MIVEFFLYSEKVHQTHVTPKLGGDVEEAFRVAVNGFV